MFTWKSLGAQSARASIGRQAALRKNPSNAFTSYICYYCYYDSPSVARKLEYDHKQSINKKVYIFENAIMLIKP